MRPLARLVVLVALAGTALPSARFPAAACPSGGGARTLAALTCPCAVSASPVQVPATQPAASLADCLDRAQKALASAKFDEAERALRQAVALEPTSVVAWVKLGQARYALKSWDAALEAFERALALQPDNVQILTNIGVCAHGRGDEQRARGALERTLQLDASNSRAHLFLARVEWAEGRSEPAEASFRRALEQARVEPIAAHDYGMFLYQSRRYGEARAVFERALTLLPDHPTTHLHLGLALDRTGEPVAARAHLQRFQELNDFSVAEHKLKLKLASLFESAQRDIEAGNPDAALATALAARELAENVPAVHVLLQRIYALLGRASDAEREAARARELGAERR
jgi:Tfp pilus assembly protein PilF